MAQLEELRSIMKQFKRDSRFKKPSISQKSKATPIVEQQLNMQTDEKSAILQPTEDSIPDDVNANSEILSTNNLFSIQSQTNNSTRSSERRTQSDIEICEINSEIGSKVQDVDSILSQALLLIKKLSKSKN